MKLSQKIEYEINRFSRQGKDKLNQAKVFLLKSYEEGVLELENQIDELEQRMNELREHNLEMETKLHLLEDEYM